MKMGERLSARQVVGYLAVVVALLIANAWLKLSLPRLLLWLVLFVFAGALLLIVVLHFFASMRFSEPADEVLQRFVSELEAEPDLARLKAKALSTWSMTGYPGIALLFPDADSLRRSEEEGLLARIARRLQSAVRHDAAFGLGRWTFKGDLGVFATCDRREWGAKTGKGWAPESSESPSHT